MINDQSGVDINLTAAADLSSYQYYTIFTSAVSTNGFATANIATAGTTNGSNRVIGVLQNTPSSGETAIVRIFGISKLATNAAVSFGDLLTGSTSGHVVTATTDEYVFAHAFSASASTSGELVTGLIFNAGWNLNSAA